MLSPTVAFRGLDPAAWRHVLQLAAPPSRVGARRPPPAGLVLFVDGDRCLQRLRVFGDRTAPLPDLADWQGAWSLGRVRRQVHAPWALAIEEGALERVAGRFEAELDHRQDLVQQLLVAARVARAEVGKGLHLDPDPFAAVPVPPYAAVQRTFDALLPDDRSAGLFVFDRARGREAIWASLVVEKRRGDVVQVTTHAGLGVDPAGFRQGAHKQLLSAMEARVARPHLALFASLDAWRDVVNEPPGALARKVALGDAVIDPAPPWMVALTGVGAMAGVAQGASRLLGRFVPQAVKDTARAVNPFAALGFDPIALFGDLRKVFDGGR